MKKKTPAKPSESAIRDALATLAAIGERPASVPRGWQGGRMVVIADSRGVLVRRVKREGIALAIDHLVARESETTYEEVTSSFNAEEERWLDAAGLSKAQIRSGIDPVELGIAEFAALLSESLTVEEAAKRLGVNGSRIRQRLTRERSLYGIKSGAAWRLPLFQFEGRRAVTGIGRVFPVLRRDIDPTSVCRWFTLPDPDLVAGKSERAISPLEWLRSGRDPSIVRTLAAEL